MANKYIPTEAELTFLEEVDNRGLLNDTVGEIKLKKTLLKALGVHNVTINGEKTPLCRAKPEQIYDQLQTEYYSIAHEMGRI